MTIWKKHFTVLFVLVGLGLFGSAFAPSVTAQDKSWGHFKGRIIVEGEIPEPTDIALSTDDKQYCIDTGQSFKDRTLVVGKNGGLQDAFVMMYFSRSDRKRPAVHPSYKTDDKVMLDNTNCRFEPHAVFLRTGQTLALKNSDRIGHNCHIMTMKNEENVSLGAGQTVELDLEMVDKIPGEIKCDAHPWMKAILLVRDEPYVAVTDAEGNFEIKNLPAGEWTFQFWHKRSGYMKTMTQDGQEVFGRRGEIKVTIPADGTMDMGDLEISIADLPKD